MGLITEYVSVRFCSNTREHFQKLGYEIPTKIGNRGKIVWDRDKEFMVKTRDLQDKSNVNVDCECDICFKIDTKAYAVYKRTIIINDGKYLCKSCYLKKDNLRRSRKYSLSKGNSFYAWCKSNNRDDMLLLWDYKNNLDTTPETCPVSCQKKYYFLCPNGVHKSHLRTVSNLTKKVRPQEIKCNECNSLSFCFPDSKKYWSNKNKKSPNDYSKSSGVVVWWKCDRGVHDDYERYICASVKVEFRCHKCVELDLESILQQKVKKYLNTFGYKILHENNCTLKCKNPNPNGGWFRYDNEVKEIGLIVESHGIQHYQDTGWSIKKAKAKNISKSEFLKYQKWTDKYKRQWALSNGYGYVAIKYTEDDKNETYKKTIDAAIKKRLKELKITK